MTRWIIVGLLLGGLVVTGFADQRPIPLYREKAMAASPPTWRIPSTVPGRYVEIRCAADEKAFYLWATVPDLTPEQPYGGPEMFRGDSLQIAFDPLNDRQLSLYAPDDFEYGFSFRNGRPDITCWVSGEPTPDTRGMRLTGGYDTARQAYRYQIRLPWERLHPFAPTLIDQPLLGCCVLVNDSQNGQRHHVETRPGIYALKNPAAFDTLRIPVTPRPVQRSGAGTAVPAVTVDWPAAVDDENRIRYAIQNPARGFGVLEMAVHFGNDPAEIPARSWTVVKSETAEGRFYFRAPWPGAYRLRLWFRDLKLGSRTLLVEHVLTRGTDALVFPDPRPDPLAVLVAADVLGQFRAGIPFPPPAPENSFERWLIQSGWDSMLAATLRHQIVKRNDRETAPIPPLPPVVMKPTDPTRNAVDSTLAWPQPDQALGRVRGVQREHEGMALLVGNWQDRAVTLKITGLRLSNGQTDLPIRPLRAETVASAEGIRVPDVLAPMADGLLTIPAREMAQLVLDITLDGTPGSYTGSLDYVVVGDPACQYSLPLQAQIVPAALPERMPIDVCMWPEYSYRHEAFDASGTAIIQDLWDHHVNVFHLGGHIQQDDQGRLSPPPEWHWLISRARRPGWQLLVFSVFTVPLRPELFNQPDQRAELVRQLRWMMAYLEKTEGLDRSEYAFYIVDEPSGEDEKTETLLQFSRLAKEVAPDLRVYANPGDRFTPARYEEFASTVDIFCPVAGLIFYPAMGRRGLNSQFLTMQRLAVQPAAATACPDIPWLDTGQVLAPETLRALREKGARVWCYDCAGSAKLLSVVDYYRKKGFGAWHFGLTGFGFWSYNHLPPEFSSWTVSTAVGDYELVYPGHPGIIPSRRWEACRDAAEDYALAWLVEQRAAEAATPAEAESLRALLRTGVARVVAAEVNQGTILHAVREQLLDCLATVSCRQDRSE